MALGKRLSTDDPLTEHDIADRLDKAALRLLRIMWDARQLDLQDAVRGSRYFTNITAALRSELDVWGIEPSPLKDQVPDDAGTRNPVTVHAFVGTDVTACGWCGKHCSHLVHHGPGIGCAFTDGICSCDPLAPTPIEKG